MIEPSEKEEIKQLIKNGFDIDLISFELDIPIKELKQLKEEIDSSKNSKRKQENTSVKQYTKIELLRERYKKLFYKDVKEESTTKKELTPEQNEEVEQCITKIKEILKQMEVLARAERRKQAIIIMKEIKKIQDYELTIEQAEILRELMNARILHRLRISEVDNINYSVRIYRKRMDRKIAEAIDRAQSKTDDLEQLSLLEERLTLEMEEKSPISVGSVKAKISNKKSLIRQQKALDRIRNDIPETIEKIIEDLANGTIDIQKSKKIIEEEAKKRVANKPRTKFSLSEEQEKRQILIQIRKAIKEKPDKFHLVDPQITLLKLQELGDVTLGQAIGIVVENLIATNNFQVAKEICNNFLSEDAEQSIVSEMIRLKRIIRSAEISSIVLKVINMQGTAEEEEACIELIEKGINMGNVNLKAISLGKSQDGSRCISLADIWTDEGQNVKI